MPDRNVLQRLIDSRNVERALRRGSSSKRAIRALQTILHELGYDKELNWEKYGADGDYGGGTTRAVGAFASQRRIEGKGEKVTLAIARALIHSLAAKEKAVMEEADAHPTEEGGWINFGSRELSRKMKGEDVAELQIRLAGFRGTAWDGDFGPGTELQVMAFQRDYMERATPSGSVDKATFQALRNFAQEFPIVFRELRCTCGQCKGFGMGKFQGEYREGKPEIEAYYKREYPGIHKAILQTYRAAKFYIREEGLAADAKGNSQHLFLTCGYRCWINNGQKGRTSTNHMGKALDCDLPMNPGDDKRDDSRRCDAARQILVEKCNFQIGWSGGNQKALEPANIAPTWIHMDVRCYSRRYLADKYFVKTAARLNSNRLVAA